VRPPAAAQNRRARRAKGCAEAPLNMEALDSVREAMGEAQKMQVAALMNGLECLLQAQAEQKQALTAFQMKVDGKAQSGAGLPRPRRASEDRHF
jgi:hypothetical protein